MKPLRVHDTESNTFHEFTGVSVEAKRIVMKSKEYGHTSNTYDQVEILFDELFSEVETLQLECDGLTKVISYMLTKKDVPHFVHTGYLSGPQGSIIHFWIELFDGRYIDYRAKLWQGEKAPHGVFDPKSKEVAHVTYTSLKKEVWEVPSVIFDILTFSHGD